VKSEVTTLEGLAKNGKLHPLQQAWIDEQVPQCGFCQNGQNPDGRRLCSTRIPKRPTLKFAKEWPDVVPLHDVLPHPSGRQTGPKENHCRRARRGPGGGGMTTFTKIPKQIEEELSRRNLLRAPVCSL
jgi:hypothetical protein